MQKQSAIALSRKDSKLTTSLPKDTGLILREQPDKAGAIELIANLLSNVATLWQIPNWTPANSVLLAEWVFNTYSCEPLEVIIKCLRNPKVGVEKIYRLTPDVVTVWMTDALEHDSVEKETELKKYKAQFNEKLPNVDYDSFRKRLAEGTALKDSKQTHWKDDPEYQKFKNDRMIKHAKEDLNEQAPSE